MTPLGSPVPQVQTSVSSFLPRRRALAAGAWWAALAVALGAFGAHGLASEVAAGHMSAADLATFETAVRYQAYAALALMAAGAAGFGGWPVRLIALGSLIFSGSLYLLVGLRMMGLDLGWLGAVTPIGGVLMIAGLIWLGLIAWRH
ncbi:DUF423 domain-containing protein [Deinococcus radiophilus]|uniref:DUF423 domain-containing protein n=1 Tax=Deinococcus radiophilus TaxID=32062 RepID=A0A431VRG8_9DEIO|nr:DUF423 domain-containing protein [Deinococcus radiophilus]RTR25786.1 DUF423 domain-containing protein [Deinococcus radiophilus]UFA50829.1 DUF423 domain-containing protein [Deinococcus radiophilus]